MSAAPKRHSPGQIVAVSVEATGWPDPDRLQHLAEAAVAAVCGAVAQEVPEGAEVSLLFTDDAAIQELNRTWRGKDKPTNVLSFPQPSGPLLGDIVLAAGTVANEAALAGRPVEDHIAHLVVHGVLHLLGYDHEDEAEAVAMEQLEAAVLAEMGVADPYAFSQQDA